MNTTDLIKKVAEETGISQADVKRVIDSSIGAVASVLAGGNEKVSITDFGTFSVVDKPARRFHNVYSGETAVSEPHSAIKFQPSMRLKNAVQ